MPFRYQTYIQRFTQLDAHLCVAVNHASQYSVIRRSFRFVSRLGDGLFWYGLMVSILCLQGLAGLSPVLHMAIAGLSGTLLYKWLKGKTLRPRPYEVRQEVRLAGLPLDKFSFPSGHTLHAVIFSEVALHYYPELLWVLLPFTFLVALSRVILGLHYPSDVLAGALVGASVASLSFSLLAVFV